MQRARQGQRGLTGVDVLLGVLVFGVVAALLNAYLQGARAAANETAATASLRAVNAAQSAFASSCGGAGFAQSLDDLGKPPEGSSQGFLSSDLAANGIMKSGYVFTMQADAGATIVTPTDRVCNAPAKHAMSGYFVSAEPASAHEGRRTFGTDTRRVIYVRDDGVAVSPGMYGAVPLR